jgi:hypothetical protein
VPAGLEGDSVCDQAATTFLAASPFRPRLQRWCAGVIAITDADFVRQWSVGVERFGTMLTAARE